MSEANQGPVPCPPCFRMTLPIRTVSEANSHEHWRMRQKRAKSQRNECHLKAKARMARFPPQPPLQVHLTRIGVRKLDSDNLQGALKHVRDGIADALGIDDGRDDLVTWTYSQELGKEYAVRIEVTGATCGRSAHQVAQ